MVCGFSILASDEGGESGGRPVRAQSIHPRYDGLPASPTAGARGVVCVWFSILASDEGGESGGRPVRAQSIHPRYDGLPRFRRLQELAAALCVMSVLDLGE